MNLFLALTLLISVAFGAEAVYFMGKSDVIVTRPIYSKGDYIQINATCLDGKVAVICSSNSCSIRNNQYYYVLGHFLRNITSECTYFDIKFSCKYHYEFSVDTFDKNGISKVVETDYIPLWIVIFNVIVIIFLITLCYL